MLLYISLNLFASIHWKTIICFCDGENYQLNKNISMIKKKLLSVLPWDKKEEHWVHIYFRLHLVRACISGKFNLNILLLHCQTFNDNLKCDGKKMERCLFYKYIGVYIDDKWHYLSKGESIRFEADKPHDYRAVTETVVFHNIVSYSTVMHER